MESWKIELYAPYLAHHGIEGQKWGVKHGPPYPLTVNKYSKAELKAMDKTTRKATKYAQKSLDKMNKSFNKYHRLANKIKDDDRRILALNSLEEGYNHSFDRLMHTPVDKLAKDKTTHSLMKAGMVASALLLPIIVGVPIAVLMSNSKTYKDTKYEGHDYEIGLEVNKKKEAGVKYIDDLFKNSKGGK